MTRSLLFLALFDNACVPSGAESVHLASVRNVTDFGYFTRTAVGEHLMFVSRLVAQRSVQGVRHTVSLEQRSNETSDAPQWSAPYVVHAQAATGSSIVAVLVAHEHYPTRVAFQLLGALLSKGADLKVSNEVLNQYETPEQVDSILSIQQKLNEAKEIMRVNIDQLLLRGDSLDVLMAKSKDLSDSSKIFYSRARKANSCCTIS